MSCLALSAVDLSIETVRSSLTAKDAPTWNASMSELLAVAWSIDVSVTPIVNPPTAYEADNVISSVSFVLSLGLMLPQLLQL